MNFAAIGALSSVALLVLSLTRREGCTSCGGQKKPTGPLPPGPQPPPPPGPTPPTPQGPPLPPAPPPPPPPPPGPGGDDGGGIVLPPPEDQPTSQPGSDVLPPKITFPESFLSFDIGGRAFALEMLPPEPSLERDGYVLEAVRLGYIRPITWVPIDLSRGGHTCTVFVSDDVVAVGNADDFVRVAVRHPTAQLIADELGALLVTTRISDAAYQQADVVLPPRPQSSDSKMAWVERMVQHHDAIEQVRAGRTGLVRTLGKDFITTNLLLGRPDRCAIFGWHSPSGQSQSPGGARVVQRATITAHSVLFTDYSQWTQLVSRRCIVDGADRDLEEVMRHPELSALVSDEGPLKLTRHPAVPPAAIA